MAESTGEKQMTASEKSELYDVLRGIQTGTVDREVATEVQSRLKSSYPNTYGTVRRELGNQLSKTSNSKGKAVTKKDIPVIAISVGMAKMQKNKKNKAAMMRGGMANGKQHMYAAGGMVNDGLKALKASGPKGMEAFNKITGK
tara:strand:+ start:1002 stop:1430 length:429 start_codon:yes stop_codon:yes gene_type:complete